MDRLTHGSETMDKKIIYIIGAVGLVLIFLIEPFAIGVIQSAGNANTGKGGDAGSNSSVASFTGTAVANITIVRYEPYLLVTGNNTNAGAVSNRLIGEGKVSYASWNGGTLIVSLKSSKDVPSVASEFEAGNATVVATAYITTSQKVTVSGNGTSVDAEGTSISMQINPIYYEGSTHEAQFAARVDAGQMVGMGQISMLPTIVKGVPVEAKISMPPQETYSVAVAWKGRALAKQLAAAAGATYKEKSYVYVANASKEALDAAVAGKSYVTGTQPGIISVQNNYTDSETIGRDLLAKGYTAVFPDSTATFSNASSASGPGDLVANLTAANISATVSADWTARITLPETIAKGGRSYYGQAGGIELAIEGSGPLKENATAMNVSVDFEAEGSRIVKITAVNPV